MDARELIIIQHDIAHEQLEGSMDLCPPELFQKHVDSSSTNPIGATYAHAIFAEDMILLGMFRGVEPVFTSGGWENKAGMPSSLTGPPRLTPEWALDFKFEKEVWYEYAEAVREEYRNYVMNAPEKVFEQERPFGPFGTRPLLSHYATLGIYHIATHQGEIAALIGLEDGKGQVL
tara:strand:- start:1010 stop:1534 length:525 start_codon:yes stop_codon:yes gene_type:complete